MQQLFRVLIFLNQPYMFLATNSPILRSTFWMYIQLLVQCADTAADRRTGRRQCRCIVPKTKSCIYSHKVLLMMGEFVAQNMYGWFTKTNKRKSCCILLITYIVVLRSVNLLAPELFFLILAHSVYEMWIIQEPNKLELWNKLHFKERKKRRVYTMFKIFGTYICWINI